MLKNNLNKILAKVGVLNIQRCKKVPNQSKVLESRERQKSTGSQESIGNKREKLTNKIHYVTFLFILSLKTGRVVTASVILHPRWS